ncbi:MAG: hypothetical protein MZV49_05135 [Rhodopseudomonas palustris]|nr:hypothetical protein [Rhodopseudomonas palustris]
MQAGIKSFGYPEDTLHVLILQLVTLLRGGEAVKMSKRAGEFITMDDLLDEVPKDAARYFFIMRNTNSHLEFDMEVAAKNTPDNPVWYIQYAHARCCSIFEKAMARERTQIFRSWKMRTHRFSSIRPKSPLCAGWRPSRTSWPRQCLRCSPPGWQGTPMSSLPNSTGSIPNARW